MSVIQSSFITFQLFPFVPFPYSTQPNTMKSLCDNERGRQLPSSQSKSAVRFVNCKCVRLENVSTLNGGLKRLDLIKSCQTSTKNDL